MQVEDSSGRGKPSILVDKDEGLGKVNRSMYICVNLSKSVAHISIF